MDRRYNVKLCLTTGQDIYIETDRDYSSALAVMRRCKENIMEDYLFILPDDLVINPRNVVAA